MSRWCKLAVEKHGRRFRLVQLVEKDATATEILKRTFPNVHIVNDICYVHKLEPCRLLLAGFPCKGTSTMNMVTGPSDALDNLQTAMVHHLFRVIRRGQQPQVILLENVKGILSARKDGKKGEFMRWLIRMLKDLGYSGEWKVFSSGVEAMSGDRVFIVCRLEGFRGKGSLLRLGHERAKRPNHAFGFSTQKVGDAPVIGRIPCLTESTGKPCLVYFDEDAGHFKCVVFQVEAIAELFTFDRKHIGCCSEDTRDLDILANACRPTGQRVVKSVVDAMLDLEELSSSEAAPEGAVVQPEGDSLPNAGYWDACSDVVFGYPITSNVNRHATVKVAMRCDAMNCDATARDFASQCLKSGTAELLCADKIRAYLEKAATHVVRRKKYILSRQLAALSLAAFPGGGILTTKRIVKVETQIGRRQTETGSVTFRPSDLDDEKGLPHVFVVRSGKPEQRAFVCFVKGLRKGWVFGPCKSAVEFTVPRNERVRDEDVARGISALDLEARDDPVEPDSDSSSEESPGVDASTWEPSTTMSAIPELVMRQSSDLPGRVVEAPSQEESPPRMRPHFSPSVASNMDPKASVTRGTVLLPQGNKKVDLDELHVHTQGKPAKVWLHIDNCVVKPSVGGRFHTRHDTKRKGRRAKPGPGLGGKFMTCPCCVGLAAIRLLINGETKLAAEKVNTYSRSHQGEAPG